jgi:penicillin-binding protein 1B
LQPAGKTGTSNDSRDSWFAGYTGEHLAVVWVGNDKYEPTGLYGATGGMRVWSELFRKLPTEPLKVSGQGIEWAWVDGRDFATTEAGCAGARRVAFVAGYLPPEHKTCQQSSWLDWFHLGGGGEQPETPVEPPPSETSQ